ncbi:hypothetical protein BH09MYX1_BH09MYX1_41470 [soil metagenome]
MASRAERAIPALAAALLVGGAAAWCQCGGGDDAPRAPDAAAAESSTTLDAVAEEAVPIDAFAEAKDLCALGFDLEPTCKHPAVAKSCAAGFCKIPHGCFILGSNRCEIYRGLYDEDPVQMTLTHDVEIQETEMTQGLWASLGFPVPNVGTPTADGWSSCVAADCPISYIAWVEALAAANALSAKKGLPACYELVSCTGSPGMNNMACADVKATTSSVYECLGYRLPTEVEWEYAARAGTRTAYYSGDPAPIKPIIDCNVDPAYESIGWYCHNSGNTSHPVKQKAPNAWGLYDMLGNVTELTTSLYTGAGYGKSPQTDRDALFPPIKVTNDYPQRGGFFSWYAAGGRASDRGNSVGPYDQGGPIMGFRLVRTLPTADAGASDASSE